MELAREVADETFHAIVTDPPYGIEWLDNEWDNPDNLWDERNLDYPSARGTGGKNNLNQYKAGEKFYLWFKPIAEQMFRTIKPGGSCFVFSSTRTLHRPMLALEDAGFEIKDTIMWNYHTGFPKAMSASLLVDKRLGLVEKSDVMGHEPLSDEAKKVHGFVAGRLKPAWEPIIWTIKPSSSAALDGEVGLLDIDSTRIPTDPQRDDMIRHVKRTPRKEYNVFNLDNCGIGTKKNMFTGVREEGRFPANVVVVDGEIVGKDQFRIMYEIKDYNQACDFVKPGRSERDAGLEEENQNPINGEFWDKKLYCKSCGSSIRKPNTTCECGDPRIVWKKVKREKVRNVHPTVKPIALFEHLIRLVTRPGQMVADFFEGSGTCALACKKSGREHWGCEKNEEYHKIATTRVANLYNAFDPWDF